MPLATLTLCDTSFTASVNFISRLPSKKFSFSTRPQFLLTGEREIDVSENKKKRPTLSITTTGSSLSANGSRRRSFSTTIGALSDGDGSISNSDDTVSKILRVVLWIAEGVYIFWLFLLPYAPGDPIWAISSETINSLIGLSLNFFLILPLLNSVGVHLIEAPVLHPMSEGLFNFVIGWTFMFAPLLYTDKKRDRYKGSLDVLWGFQMFLTNTFLIPYMAIRLNEGSRNNTPRKNSQLGSIMANRAPVVGIVGGVVCLLSIVWAIYGRGDNNFGDLPQRWEFVLSYLGSERLAYAFIWDICLYIIFQPWLIGENLQNIRKDKVAVVNFLRFVPFVGLTAYCLCLNIDDDIVE